MSLITKEVSIGLKIIKVSRLAKCSHKIIRYKCDSCGLEKDTSFAYYCRKHSNKLKEQDFCLECKNKIEKEKILSKRFKDKNKREYKYYYNGLIKNNFKMVTTIENIGKSDNIEAICLKHEDKGVLTISKKTLNNGISRGKFGCRHCKVDKFIARVKHASGKDHYNWQGGITELNHHLRQTIAPWVTDSMKQCNFKCILSGGKNWEVHHLKSFNSIVADTLGELNLPVKLNLGSYSRKQLNNIDTKCLQLHYESGYGVCLEKSLHTLFHIYYGYGDNTPEQFQEFTERYNNGEFKEIS